MKSLPEKKIRGLPDRPRLYQNALYNENMETALKTAAYDWETEARFVNWIKVFPPHQVEDCAKMERIQADMDENGWQGRPLLVVEYGDGLAALTGSHRWAAARELDMRIPVIEVDAEKFYGEGYTIEDMWDDDVRLSILEKIGDERAYALMLQEIEANENA
jgi:hypothetical protein